MILGSDVQRQLPPCGGHYGQHPSDCFGVDPADKLGHYRLHLFLVHAEGYVKTLGKSISPPSTLGKVF